uniref:Uncharacterized protein n=1 Tax=Setaria digitata TaxID=48799 RepID=A0A915Q793_9BILA
MSGRTTPLHDYDGDILEEDPRYRNVAPPKPVIHRRASTDWENFTDKDETDKHEGELFLTRQLNFDPCKKFSSEDFFQI